jgi:UDP-N-acetylmuramyl pentapeptide phosphotransferase/UDP-N-acetylglucosamine-1-phosphate transferase
VLDISTLTWPLLVGVLASFGLSVLVVLTTRWHGAFSMDESAGIQKVHAHPTPRIGGLPMVAGLVAAWWAMPADLQQKFTPWLVAGMPAFAFGLAEDFTKRVSVTLRLLATMASGVLAWWLTGYSLHRVDVWGFDLLLQWLPFSVLFTAFAVGGVANSINIIDGLNGLASSMVLWAFLGLAGVAHAVGDPVLAMACLMMAATVAGFFLVNWPMGKLFLGDGGSYFLGFSLAWACVLLIERHSEVSAFTALLLCVHPITEVLFSVYRRRMRNEHPGHPDRLHFHSLVKRRVMQRLLPHSSKTVRNSVGGLLVGAMSILPAVVVQFVYTSTVAAVAVSVLLMLGYVALYKRMMANFGR